MADDKGQSNNDDLLESDENANEEADKLLNDEKKEEEESADENKDKKPDGDKPDGEEEKFNKTIGSQVFTDEKEYDAAVQKMSGTNSNFAGEIKRLGGDPKNLGKEKEEEKPDEKPDEKKEEVKQDSDEEIYYKQEAFRFTKQFPDSKEYKEEMAVLIKNGRANIDGSPSFALAFGKSLRGDGKEIPEKLLNIIKAEKGIEEDAPSSKPDRSSSKKIMKAGSPAGNDEQKTYDRESLEDTKDFANGMAAGKF